MAAEHTARIGVRIRDVRKDMGLTQRELAERLPGKTDGNQISKWERGAHRPSDDVLEQLASVLGVDVSAFLVPEPQAGAGDLMGALGPPAPEGQVSRIEARLAAIEEKLDAVMGHLGLELQPAEIPSSKEGEEILQLLEADAPLDGTQPDSTGSTSPAPQGADQTRQAPS